MTKTTLYRRDLRIFLMASTLLALTAGAPSAVHAATVVVVNNDGAGEGFNDPTPAAPTGGNTGTTVGAQRLIAFQRAADIWGANLSSTVPIRVQAQFNPLSCNDTSAILGSAGPANFFRDFTGAPLASTWYPVALANALHGSDLDPSSDDISATFSSTIGTPGCLSSSGWYYGLDGNAPANRIDFVSVLVHELGHGLGFLTIVDLATGAKASGFNDVFMRNLENHGASPPDYPSMTNAQRVTASTATGSLHWTGTNVRAASGVLTAGKVGDHVRMYAPNPQQSGSSVSHWDTALTPDQIMEPSYTGVHHDPGLELALFQDIGWTTTTTATPTLQVAPSSNMVAAGGQGGPFAPLSFQYQLTATSSSVNFSISGVPSWLTASFTSGTATTSPLSVTFTVNNSANALAVGSYGPNAIAFTNTSNGSGNTARNASIVVSPIACEAVAKFPEFNADGHADMAWLNDSGQVGVWLLNGTAVTAATIGNAPSGWRIVGSGDLDGDKKADLLWRHTSGALGVWFVNGASVTSATTLATVDNSWHVVGAADLDGDGKADIIWRHDSGAVGAWMMNGATILSATTIASVDNQWRLIGSGDFDGDGKTDLLWRHSSGAVGIWFMNGASVTSAVTVASATNDWHVVGIGDLDGDGKADLIWRNDNGTVGAWLMNGSQLKLAASIGAVTTDWHVVGAGDVNGDKKADILWRNDNGTVATWLMNGTSITSAANIASATNDWHIVGGEHDRPIVPIAPGPCS